MPRIKLHLGWFAMSCWVDAYSAPERAVALARRGRRNGDWGQPAAGVPERRRRVEHRTQPMLAALFQQAAATYLLARLGVGRQPVEARS